MMQSCLAMGPLASAQRIKIINWVAIFWNIKTCKTSISAILIECTLHTTNPLKQILLMQYFFPLISHTIISGLDKRCQSRAFHNNMFFMLHSLQQLIPCLYHDTVYSTGALVRFTWHDWCLIFCLSLHSSNYMQLNKYLWMSTSTFQIYSSEVFVLSLEILSLYLPDNSSHLQHYLSSWCTITTVGWWLIFQKRIHFTKVRYIALTHFFLVGKKVVSYNPTNLSGDWSRRQFSNNKPLCKSIISS